SLLEAIPFRKYSLSSPVPCHLSPTPCFLFPSLVLSSVLRPGRNRDRIRHGYGHERCRDCGRRGQDRKRRYKCRVRGQDERLRYLFHPGIETGKLSCLCLEAWI